jgi:hypothetical protein
MATMTEIPEHLLRRAQAAREKTLHDTPYIPPHLLERSAAAKQAAILREGFLQAERDTPIDAGSIVREELKSLRAQNEELLASLERSRERARMAHITLQMPVNHSTGYDWHVDMSAAPGVYEINERYESGPQIVNAAPTDLLIGGGGICTFHVYYDSAIVRQQEVPSVIKFTYAQPWLGGAVANEISLTLSS